MTLISTSVGFVQRRRSTRLRAPHVSHRTCSWVFGERQEETLGARKLGTAADDLGSSSYGSLRAGVLRPGLQVTDKLSNSEQPFPWGI